MRLGDMSPGRQCDPIEKKPFFHAYPVHSRTSFGMLGCDLPAVYCQTGLQSRTNASRDLVESLRRA